MAKIDRDLKNVIRYMEQELRVSENFDLVCRTITLGKYHCAVYCISGFTKSELLEKLLEAMMKQAD